MVNLPRISKELFAQVLREAASPAADIGEECYDIVKGYGLDPAIALAFFRHESTYGREGVAARSKNWGNLRRGGRAREEIDGFAYYDTWRDSLLDWCDLIRHRYVEELGLDTVDKVLYRYAPPVENATPHYIARVEGYIREWVARDPYGAPEDESRERLRDALFRAIFERAGAKYHPDWAFHQYAEAQALQEPVGTPLGDSSYLEVAGQKYAVQIFALDTLYTPVADPAEGTDWGVVKRMTDLQDE
jgi:hypothetical protein